MKITYHPVHLTALEKHLRDRSITIAMKRGDVILMFDSRKEANAVFDELSEFADKDGEAVSIQEIIA